jgi:hypothetical protein
VRVQFHTHGVADLELLLNPYQQQLAAEPPIKMTVGEAVKKGIIANESLGYFVGECSAPPVRAAIESRAGSVCAGVHQEVWILARSLCCLDGAGQAALPSS